MNDRILTNDEEMAEAASITEAIDALTDAMIDAGQQIEERDGGPMTSLLIAEGVLARIIAAFAKAYGGGQQEGLDDLLAISARHVREMSQSYWDRLPEEPETDAAQDA